MNDKIKVIYLQTMPVNLSGVLSVQWAVIREEDAELKMYNRIFDFWEIHKKVTENEITKIYLVPKI